MQMVTQHLSVVLPGPIRTRIHSLLLVGWQMAAVNLKLSCVVRNIVPRSRKRLRNPV